MDNPENPHSAPSPAAPPVASPCIRHCTLNEHDVCVGCGRTLADITTWTKMSEADKAQCVARAAERIHTGQLRPT